MPITRSAKTYMFRFECYCDAMRIKKRVHGIFKVVSGSEVELTTSMPIDDIIEIMKSIPDCTTAEQTIMPIDKYTGIRVYRG